MNDKAQIVKKIAFYTRMNLKATSCRRYRKSHKQLCRLFDLFRKSPLDSRPKDGMVHLYIEEEYGFRNWMAILTQDEYQQLLRRWETMRGLNCLVPVTWIVPQAKELNDYDYQMSLTHQTHRCHIHECDDSYLDGTSYVIPEADRPHVFQMDGKEYGWQDYP